MGTGKSTRWAHGHALLAGVAALLGASSASAEPPAASFELGDNRAQAIGCMTNAVLHEAGFESSAGQEAVAEVVMNRLRNRAYPKTVCGVVFQGSARRTGCQFSFTCDGSLRRSLAADVVARARDVAVRAIDGQLVARTSGATHYHADYVSPYWAPSLVRLTAIGRHIFYRQLGAAPVSSLARYDPAREQMPIALAGETMAGSATMASIAPERSRPTQPFMPWGLAPVVTAQAATGSN